MSKRNKHFGRCCICGENKKLTFEHIPPNKAFNSMSTKILTGDEITKLISDPNRLPWETHDLKYKLMQRGVGIYSLCDRCNSLTGAYYGDAYIYLANIFHFIISTKNPITPGIVHIEIKNVFPQRFIKQVLSMFCSTYDKFSMSYPDIKEILLNKNCNKIDFSKLKITMHLIKNYTISYSGLNIVFYENGNIRTLASLSVYPFCFTLELNPKNASNKELDITNFINYDYDECIDLDFSIPIYERNTMFPEDHRNREEFIKIQKNKIYAGNEEIKN